MLLQRFDVRVLLWVLAAPLWLAPATNGAGLQLYLGDNDWAVQGLVEDERFGQFAYPAGDVNGDGYDDVLVGAYRYDWNSVDSVHHAYLFFGSDSGLDSGGSRSEGTPANCDWSVRGEQPLDGFGLILGSGGDLDGDGYDEIFVGAQADAGKVWLWYGSDSALSAGPPDWQIAGDHDSDILGFSVDAAGDFNQDGYADLLISQPRWDPVWDPNNHTNTGRVGLWLGSAAGPQSEPLPIYADCLMAGDQEEGLLGLSVAGVGDVDKDGFDDLLLTSESYDTNDDGDTVDDQGKVFLFRGQGLISADDFESADWLRWSEARQ